MRDLSEDALTLEVERAVSNGANERLGDISRALVRHLHAFVREVEPTQEEWEAGIRFLTRTGHMSTTTRQEFILLSDVLGVSMLVDAINHRRAANATASTVFGPFFVEDRPVLPLGADMAPEVAGTPLFVSGRVLDANGTPLPQAVVDAWHSDDEGHYDVQVRDGLTMRGSFRCDEQGRFWFRTVRPRFYPIPDDGPVGDMLKAQGRHPFRPEHVHFMISAPDHETLVTHLFVEGDPYLDSDVVFGVKSSLIVGYQSHPAGPAPDGTTCSRPFLTLAHDFRLAPRTTSGPTQAAGGQA